MIQPVNLSKSHFSIDENSLKNLAASMVSKVDVPFTLCFYGDLGAGKSTFCRQFIQTFLNDPNHVVPSPTFTLVQEYVKDDKSIYHFDLYRLESAEELVELNFEECLLKGICLIEWPEKAKLILPKKRLDVFIKKEDDNHRNVIIHQINDTP